MPVPTWSRLFLLFAFCVASALPASGQGRLTGLGLDDLEMSGVPYYRYAKPGEVTVKVIVLGGGRTGIFEVGESTQLDELLAISGGAGGGERGSRTVRDVTIRLFRQDEGKRGLIYEAPLQQMMQNPGAYPDLQDDDIFVVETVVHQRFGWRDTFQIATGLSAIILLITRVADYFL